MIRPHITLLFLIAVGMLCFGLMFIVPEGGVKVAGVTVRYPTWDEFVQQDTTQRVDVEAIIRASHMTRIDTAGQAKSEEEKKAREHLMKTLELRKIQFASTDTIRLSKLRAALEEIRDNGGKLRVLHFGDSQIEGDRITSLIRNEWTKAYGGEGPGMLDAMPLAPTFSVNQTHSDNWARYAAFGKRDTNITHTSFGLRAVLCRYTPPQGDSTATDTTMGWLEFKPSNMAYSRARTYHQMRLHYRNPDAAFRLTVYANDTLLTEQIIQPGAEARVRSWTFSKTPEKLRVEFKGKVSPDVYGVSLEGNSGIVVDNIPMRGASGVIFTRMSRSHLNKVLSLEPVELIIYQYGGNTVPYIKSKEQAATYARRVRRQIQRLKQLAPDATILMIGPSDMSTKSGTSFVTYEAVPWVRDELKAVAMAENVPFWDIFGAMGGLNSMPAWVGTNPPLAGPDHVHFTPKGARQVGEWLTTALSRELFPNHVENPADSVLIPGTQVDEN
ncbi:GDSL-type esterase/lipase family protein [Phaeocystidibacter luteus]|uniref:SGNH hydrolase-type esterase domain-containing protein n=1 Tax=Phaeocystidibacter luteus TaxID=911197 RepID=A0A6N6RM88_9FLAO|nr:GDSL-type esterase/lipase family protein [Phaeocystidibacter luteus]KAB2814689.1 hypothetical protein F8C67_02800 [Phaeocystidibacter luteus]